MALLIKRSIRSDFVLPCFLSDLFKPFTFDFVFFSDWLQKSSIKFCDIFKKNKVTCFIGKQSNCPASTSKSIPPESIISLLQKKRKVIRGKSSHKLKYSTYPWLIQWDSGFFVSLSEFGNDFLLHITILTQKVPGTRHRSAYFYAWQVWKNGRNEIWNNFICY